MKAALAQSEAEQHDVRKALYYIKNALAPYMEDKLGAAIKTVEAALAQSDAEPVAWRWRWRADPPNEWHFAVNEFHGEQIIIEPLFTGPPRPNTSAGLIEAAEWLGREAYNEGTTNRAFYYNEAANVLRARAADRSGK